MDDLYWRYMLRFKLRRIPLEKRREWTDQQLVTWYLGLPEHSDVRGVTSVLMPSFPTVKRLCADMVGARAAE